GSGSATASSDEEAEADVVQQQEQQQHVPRESPLRILQLKSEGMVELLREELRGFSMPQEA
ncbi:MAG: hypothetical protein M1830_005075, partial [Pleopsidium flavum]